MNYFNYQPPMKILITGICGFIGNHLNRYIQTHHPNAEIWGIDNFISGDNLDGIDQTKFIRGDICDLDTFSTIPDVDYIFHLACPASPVFYNKFAIETMQTCSQGTANICVFMQHHKVYPVMVFTSSSEIYGNPTVHPQTEDYAGNVNVTHARSLYAEGKRFAEALIGCMVREYKMDIRIARLFNVYGSGMNLDDGRVISSFISSIDEDCDLIVYGGDEISRTYCNVHDMVRMISALGFNKLLGEHIVMNLGSDNPLNELSNLTLANLMLKTAFKIKPNCKSNIIVKDKKPNDVIKRKPDLTIARSQLGNDVMNTISILDSIPRLIIGSIIS